VIDDQGCSEVVVRGDIAYTVDVSDGWVTLAAVDEAA
jgi:hypothetical protein